MRARGATLGSAGATGARGRFDQPRCRAHAIKGMGQKGARRQAAGTRRRTAAGREGKSRPVSRGHGQRIVAGESDGARRPEALPLSAARSSRARRASAPSRPPARWSESATRGASVQVSPATFLLAVAEDESDRIQTGRAEAQSRAIPAAYRVGPAPPAYARTAGRHAGARRAHLRDMVAEAFEARRPAVAGMQAMACLAEHAPERRWPAPTRSCAASAAAPDLGESGSNRGGALADHRSRDVRRCAAPGPPAAVQWRALVGAGIATCGQCGAGLTGQLRARRGARVPPACGCSNPRPGRLVRFAPRRAPSTLGNASRPARRHRRVMLRSRRCR